MTTFSLPKGCKGLDMADGTRYDATHSHKVTIDSPAHERAYRASENFEHIGVTTSPAFAAIKTRPNICECGFNAWPWQKTCPSCNTSLPIDAIS